jgi:hypothetical protein
MSAPDTAQRAALAARRAADNARRAAEAKTDADRQHYTFQAEANSMFAERLARAAQQQARREQATW